MIKTIDIQAKKWFQRLYGNTYFTAEITVNFDMESEQSISLPFQYGFGNHFEDVARNELVERGLVTKTTDYDSLHSICHDMGIILRSSSHDVKRKKDL